MPTTPPKGKEIQLRGDSILQLPFVPPASLYGARLDDIVDVDASDTTDGKVLTRQADGSFALEAVPGGGGGGGGVSEPLIRSGLFYAAQDPADFSATLALSVDTFYLVPFRVSAAVTWDAIYTRVTTGGPGAVRLGIYTGGETADSFSLLRDAGTVAVGTTGDKVITGMAQAVAVGTLLWLCLLPGAAFTVAGCAPANLRRPILFGSSASNSGPVSYLSLLSAGAGSAALPATLSGLSVMTGTCPLVGLKL